MRTIRHMMTNAALRPFVLLALLIAGFAILQGNGGAFFGRNTAFSVFQHFATIGLVALALGMTMLMREFDLSVAGMMGLGGCVAVLTGNHHTGLGIAAAMLVGMLGGLVQGSLAVRLGLGSIAVSLGGLLTFTGIAYVLTGNQAIPFHDMETAIAINAPLLGIMSLRTLVVCAAFIVAALVITYTRIGRDIIAAGSDRHASIIAGTSPQHLLVGVFTASGALSALAGAMLSYGLTSASPAGSVSDILVPAVTAAILGGVSLSGGVGHPAGIAAGVLILCVLRTGLTSLGAAPYVHDIVTGAILLAVAIADGPYLKVRWFQLRQLVHPPRIAPSQGD